MLYTHEVKQIPTIAENLWFITVTEEEEGYTGIEYLWRYAYDTKKDAEVTLSNIRVNFGKPADIETDLAFNYFRRTPSLDLLVAVKKNTTRKFGYNIVKKGV